MEVLQGAQIAEVEDRSQVDEEPLVALSGEHGLARAEAMHGGLGERLVVRRGARADVAGRRRQLVADDLRLRSTMGASVPDVPVPMLPVVDTTDVIELPLVPTRAIEAG